VRWDFEFLTGQVLASGVSVGDPGHCIGVMGVSLSGCTKNAILCRPLERICGCSGTTTR